MKRLRANHNALDEPCFFCGQRGGWLLHCAPLPDGAPAPEGWRCRRCGEAVIPLEVRPYVRRLLARIGELESAQAGATP